MTRKETVICIDNISCTSCAANVERALIQVEGVDKATVNFDAGNATVEYNAKVATLYDLEQAVENSGYSVCSKKKDSGFSFEDVPLVYRNEMIKAVRINYRRGW